VFHGSRALYPTVGDLRAPRAELPSGRHGAIYCNDMLARYGVEVTCFDLMIGAAIEGLFTPKTLTLRSTSACRQPPGRSRLRA
jgi:hypothetical protein